jgi:hypothetical protein
MLIFPGSNDTALNDLVESHLSIYDRLTRRQHYARRITKYFIRLHATESFESFVSTYDAPYSKQDQQQCFMLREIGRFLKQNQMIDHAEFQRTFDIITTSGSRPTSFRDFNSRLGRPVPTTPTPPVRDSSFQTSPIVEPVSRNNPFSNLPPYARSGVTRESPRFILGLHQTKTPIRTHPIRIPIPRQILHRFRRCLFHLPMMTTLVRIVLLFSNLILKKDRRKRKRRRKSSRRKRKIKEGFADIKRPTRDVIFANRTSRTTQSQRVWGSKLLDRALHLVI